MLFTRLPITVSDTSLPVIPSSDIELLMPYADDAYEHWLFDRGDATNLVGRVNERSLALQGAAPVYHETYLTLPSAAGGALLTGRPDTVDAFDTMCAVVRMGGPAGIKAPLGTLGATTGAGIFLSSAAHGMYSTLRPSVGSLLIASPAELDIWYFIAMSRDLATATRKVTHLVGGFSMIEAAPTSYLAAAGNIAVGNAYYTTGSAGTIDVGEFIYFDRAVAASELLDIYAESKVRMAARGIAVH